MRQLFSGQEILDSLGNLPPQPEIYPDQPAPIVRAGSSGGLAFARARWGLLTPPQYLVGRKVARGVTNVRNAGSPHWRRWLGRENRCLVPLTSFAEPHGAGLGNAWFAHAQGAPMFFAGIHVPGWTSVRKQKDRATTDDLFAFLITAPNAEVAAVPPKAMPVILTHPSEWKTWLEAGWSEARLLQRPLPDGSLLVGEASADPAGAGG
ncbi:SOS response-associated peptidase [Cereibacter sphaeroides]|uniref:Abasic site processing protein n=2 Tax=Cereibacter azotoformans TaxID=43057 RepID=A0A2T5JLI2_9RHOB|nr:SOS response-associated peptidase [Cereibacter sphaeroides]PTR07658.1 putative SOS response-associated peptidase YedK [Cereibacter azotoformans]